MAAHAKLGPSAADRWMQCTASVALIDDLAGRGVVDLGKSSVYADEGTAAHEVRQHALSLGLDAHDFVGMTVYVNGQGYAVTDDMAEFLQPGIDWIREHTSAPDVEIRVDLSPWLPDQFGTMDAGWVNGVTLYASDLKYGMGEPVDPVKNRQQMLYALGYWHYKGRPAVEKIVVCIDQPRAGGLKFWDCSLKELLSFGDVVEDVWNAIQRGDTEFMPTDKGCRWCAAKEAVPSKGYLGCDAYSRKQLDLFAGAFDDLDAPEPAFADPLSLTPARRAYIVTHAKQATKWLASLHEASLEAALMGRPDPGMKVVIGQKGDRYFTDKSKAEAILVSALGDDAYKPRAIIGITDVEKHLKPGTRKKGDPVAWAALQELIDQPAGKPVLASVDDPRPAVPSFADELEDL